MDPRDLLDQLLHWQTAETSLGTFAVDLLAVALLSLLLGQVYIRCGRSLSNRRAFAWNFVFIATTTLLVISVVKTSLALSLGLVGALSIVRFRAAIKEPEELCYLFLAVAIGLGFGGGKRGLTVAAVLAIALLSVLRHVTRGRAAATNLHLSLACAQDGEGNLLEALVAILQRHCRRVSLTRLDEGAERFEALFAVEFAGFPELERCRAELRAARPDLQLSLLETQAIG